MSTSSESSAPRCQGRSGFRPAARAPLRRLRSAAALAAVLATAPAPAQTIAEKAQLCAACHGENGVPQQTTTPVIWGQYQGYLYLELRDYKSGARQNEIMSPLAQALERDDMMALALYFSQKRWPDLQQPQAPGDVAARATRVNVSIGCTGCHQGQYQGEGTQPRLSGQSKEYMQQTMLDFRTHKRGNNPGMTDLMLAISADDIAALAQYLAGLQYIAPQ
ncbi:MAG TPA: c-type cytochrome [Xanthobacteraceae bacterium]|jgi:cytochrome c553